MSENIKKQIDLKILMMDNNTREDAEKCLENGAIVFSTVSFMRYCKLCVEDWGDEKIGEQLQNMMDTKIPLDGWGIVKTKWDTYYILY